MGGEPRRTRQNSGPGWTPRTCSQVTETDDAYAVVDLLRAGLPRGLSDARIFTGHLVEVSFTFDTLGVRPLLWTATVSSCGVTDLDALHA